MEHLVNKKYRKVRPLNQHGERLLELAEVADTKVVMKSMPLTDC